MTEQERNRLEKQRKSDRFKELNKTALPNQIVCAGSSLMEMFPVEEFAKEDNKPFVVYNRGIGGYVAKELLDNIDVCILDLKPRRLFINIGTNDLSNSSVTIADLMKDYDHILNKVKSELPKIEIYIMAYFPINFEAATPEMKECLKVRTNERINEAIKVYLINLNPTNAEGIQETIVAVNNGIKELANSYDFATQIDIHSEFVNDFTGSPANPDCTEYHVNMDLVMADGLHPVSAGYKIWAGKLKEAMQSEDTTDTSLTTLSYRESDTEAKYALTGFKTGVSTGDENVYEMALPRNMADDATFKLFITPSNLSATVTPSTGEILTDSYGDDYMEITLESGESSVVLTVTSEDGTAKETYTINFANNGPVNGQKAEVTDETVELWPWVEYSADSQTVYSGAKIEIDVAVDNDDFTGIWIESDFNWIGFKTKTLTPDDFENGIAHLEMTYIGETIDALTGIQFKTGTEITDYRGNLTFFNLEFTNGTEQAEEEPEGLEEIVIFEGEEKGTDVVTSVYTDGNFDLDNITEDGYFYVTYKADSKDSTIRFALSDWETERWLEVAPTASGEISEGVYYAKFSYAGCVNMNDGADFSAIEHLFLTL